MKKFSTLTPEQYAALKKHLVLINRSDVPEDDEYPYTSNCFPCYRFEPGELSVKDESIEAVVLLGRRNPWNCAQLIASMMPQVLDLIPEEPWYKTALHNVWRFIRKDLRDYASFFVRLRLAIRHRDKYEIVCSLARILTGFFYGIICLGFAFCIIAGFFKPHCFITAIFYAVLVGLWRTSMKDMNNIWK